MIRMYDQYSQEIKFSELPSPDDTWLIQDLIGTGTYGEVYSAKHKVTGELVAVKVLESIHEMIEEVEEEYRILRDFSNHPNMPRFHGLYMKRGDSGADDQLWFVMELCMKGSVTDLSKALVEQGKQLQEVMIAHILKETVQLLSFFHKHHVIHRDIKGHNVLITEHGDIKLIDFGVSGHLNSTRDKRKTSVGTPFWMAPEVIACERQLDYSYDIRCDVWSLGIMAIELADAEPPLADKHPMRALFRIPRNPPPQVKRPNDWSATFRDFISRCLMKDYEKRPWSWELLEHPFLKQVPADISQMKQQLLALTSQMERVIHEPDITTKQGRLKSGRKARRIDQLPTVDDLAKLEVLDEETIVSQLFTRYSQGIIYTYIGDILLAVNPFQPFPIYNEEHSKRYMNAAKADNSPHIFAIADQAYQMMMHQKKHQCIVISGESGAGKTESANFLVQQLTQLGKAPNRDLEEKILQVNPLMEAFGNAKTIINDNSSRFGKYLEMLFTVSGTVTGAQITEYLLEKSRVISQALGEQNFHIFYYIYDGLAVEDKQQVYHLKDSVAYRYISEYTGQPPDITTLSFNRVKFKAIQHCFDIIGFKPDEVVSIFGVLAAILHTGNVEFQEIQSNVYSGEACEVANMGLVEIIAKLLGLVSKDLVECLVSTGMVARGEIIIRENTVPEATDARDAMAKALYGRLFSWIVNKINVLLKPDRAMYKQEQLLMIGLLDIFGFENFSTNSFEQLCINIANEQIQYYFNQHIFAWEMQEYENEGVDGSVITFVDNRPLLDMFLAKPMGLLALLDEESHFPKATDLTLVEKFNHNIKNQYYIRSKAHISLIFTIEHYAGRVQYDTVNFLEKNRDRLPVEIINLLRASDNPVVRTLFQTPLTKTGNLAQGTFKAGAYSSGPASPSSNASSISIVSLRSTPSGMGGSRASSSTTASMTRIQQTVATYFRYSLMDLLAKMVAGSPHFVRCIRPNEEKLPDQFDSVKVTVQLTYTGVLETTRIRREGYSHRIPFLEFIQRYSVLGLKFDEPVPYDRTGCELLLTRLKLKHWAIGHTKVFLKYYHIEMLSRRFEDLVHKVVLLQSLFRMSLARNRFFEMKWKREKATVIIQAWTRGWAVRRTYCKVIGQRRAAALAIQRATRGYLVRRKTVPEIQRRRTAAVRIQSHYRGFRARQSVHSRRSQESHSAVVIQKAFRSYRAQRIAKQVMSEKRTRSLTAAIRIQTYYRMWRCQTVYQQLLKYKEQKELQLIYFSQQVEAYGNEVEASLTKNNGRVKPISDTPEKLSLTTEAPAEKKASPQPQRKKRRAPTAPVAKQPEPVAIVKPDVSEERLEHLDKMRDVKCLMPEREFHYYRGMMAYYHHASSEEQMPMAAPDVVNGDSNTETEPEPEIAVVPASKKMLKKELLDERTDSYYRNIADRVQPTADSELRLGQEAADLRPVIDWDAPLEAAKVRVLSTSTKPEVVIDEHWLQTPPSPPMQLSPYDALSNASSGDSSSTVKEDSAQLDQGATLLTLDSAYTHHDTSHSSSSNSSIHSNIEPVHLAADSSPFATSTTHFATDSAQLTTDSAHLTTDSAQVMVPVLDSLKSDSTHSFTKTSHDESRVSTEPDDHSRDQLARTVAEAILANSPDKQYYQAWLQRRQEPRWDSPLQLAYPASHAPPSSLTYTDTSAQISKIPSDNTIEQDLTTDRDEFYAESDQRELLDHLEEEHRHSARGQWQRLQRLILSRQFRQLSEEGIVGLDEETETKTEPVKLFKSSHHRQWPPPSPQMSKSTNQRQWPPPSSPVSKSANQRQRSPSPPMSKSTNHRQRSPPSPQMENSSYQRQWQPASKPVLNRTVINVSKQNSFNRGQERAGDRLSDYRQGSKVKFSSSQPTIIGTSLTTNNNNILRENGNHLTPGNRQDVNFRAVLKANRIDPEVSRVQSPTEDGEKPIYDFRKLLKRTGRLDLVIQQQQQQQQ